MIVYSTARYLTESGCATLFGEKYLTSDQLAAQHHKPEKGEAKRKIRPVVEDVHKIKIEGLDKNFYLCTDCLHSVPKLSDKIVEQMGKKG